MKTVYKNRSVTKNKTHSKESGFVILMGLLILVLGAAAWFGSQGNIRSESMKQDVQSDYASTLQQVKERMLTYAVLHPELFDSTPPGTPPGGAAIDLDIPGIGYFPCPDVTGDGESNTNNACSRAGNLYSIGWVPQKIVNRNFSFLPSTQESENKRYWFAVDVRFLVDGRAYLYGAGWAPIATRFAPLNSDMSTLVDRNNPTQECDDTNPSPTCVAPLTLDGRAVVMVLFYAGGLVNNQTRQLSSTARRARFSIDEYLEQPSLIVPSSSASADNNVPGVFISQGADGVPFNDHVIAITRDEWNAAMLSRVARDVETMIPNVLGAFFPNLGPDGIPDLCHAVNNNITVVNQDSWFNKCRFRGGIPIYAYGGDGCDNITGVAGVVNIEGQNWREALGCPL